MTRMMTTRMMTSVMMKSCNHQLMRWTLLFSLWILSKVSENFIFILFRLTFWIYFFLLSNVFIPCLLFYCLPFAMFSSTSSLASIGCIEVPEPYAGTWLPLSSPCQWCCPACWTEESRDWKGKNGEGSGYCCFLSFWFHAVAKILFCLLHSIHSDLDRVLAIPYRAFGCFHDHRSQWAPLSSEVWSDWSLARLTSPLTYSGIGEHGSCSFVLYQGSEL